MKHIYFIDPLEKLNTKKDSTMLMGLTSKDIGHESYFLFEKDFFIQNTSEMIFDCYEFSGEIKEDFYVANLQLGEKKQVKLDGNCTLHMRIDPPYDSRYQRYLWMLNFLSEKGVNVANNPIGIMKHNEKLEAYKIEGGFESYVGASLSGAIKFVQALKTDGVEYLILKPLDLFQGIGVEKIHVDQLEERFPKKAKEYHGPVVIQAFEAKVAKGEIRSIFYKAKELGTILKVPKDGEFLANIAQGASFHQVELSSKLVQECETVCKNLMKDGVDLVAFDILGDKISEVNVTCPGLLVEVSHAVGENLAKKLF
ncbi:glutathione synthetase/glutathione synthetase [Bacteriovorax sp. Seq25_V]|uniref:glutathione synthetase/glutathione synthetase n=1 Tax=Bacteriovorax sp. Seq25_V TaxID=1201288 RepID=UPI00038A0960|nr:glutathione synthetase/glutathione synthetase [Bacteriovorax sp. Seq25_V]EQC46596.1 prokaryotic glutathione synthetase, N-terminal domain/glutathione synthetase, ATP-binding domain multi-domain protein [Bacteriovorax sp. Seq25_V]